MPSKLEHALQLASDGFYIFPCDTKANKPQCKWREASTRNPDTIRAWFMCPVMGWDQDRNIGVDCFKSGVTTIDVDVKDGKKGRESFEAWEKELGWGKTRVQKTASGGLHLIYRANGFKNSVEKLAPGIDVRGDGGYYIAAGSTKGEREYTLALDMEPQPLPAWLEEKLTALGKATPIRERLTGKSITEDNPNDIAAAIEFLIEHEPAVYQSAGDTHTYVTFCQLKERGVSLQTAIDLASEYWNPNCIPPWDEADLEAKAVSAYKSAQNATGSKSPYAEFEIPQDSKKETVLIPDNFSGGYLLPDAASFPRRDWVFGKIALAKNVTLIIAPPGVGKSTLTLAMALSKTSGRNLLGIEPLEKGCVAVFNNEDTVEEQSRRLVAAAQYYKLSNENICFDNDLQKGSMLYLNGRDNAPLKIAKRMTDGTIRADQAGALVSYLVKHSIRMLIVDPLAMTHPASENSNEEMLVIGNLYAEVANRANCAVILVHHTRKLSTADSEGHSGNLDSARGASSLGGLARVAYTLNVLSKQDAKLYAIEPKDKNRFLLFEQAKANMSAPGEHRLFFERYGEVIGANPDNIDGESVGVLRPAPLIEKMPDNGIGMLIKSIEDYSECKDITVNAIAEKLIAHSVFFSGKQSSALMKAIDRLFTESTTIVGFKSHIHIEQLMEGKKKTGKKLVFSLFENNGFSADDLF